MALESEGVFPPMVIRMVAVGEHTGQMERGLGKIYQYYDREVPSTVKKVFSAMEPLVIFVLAIIVIVIALSIFLPLYKMASVIGSV